MRAKVRGAPSIAEARLDEAILVDARWKHGGMTTGGQLCDHPCAAGLALWIPACAAMASCLAVGCLWACVLSAVLKALSRFIIESSPPEVGFQLGNLAFRQLFEMNPAAPGRLSLAEAGCFHKFNII